MLFEVLPLPYPKNALEPHISQKTVELHYEKHHRGYMEKLRKQIEGKPEGDGDLEDLVRTADGGVFNNAAQVWNHSFYWLGMQPDGGGKPEGALLRSLDEHFGSEDGFRQQLRDVANAHFGSGWAWLACEPSGGLRVGTTADADNPLRHGLVPLLALDLWEHAYYLDYQNERARYIDQFIERLIDWEFVARNLTVDRAEPSFAARPPRRNDASATFAGR